MYERRFVAGDLAGGLAVSSILIPQGLAFAQIIHVPPVAGLWSGIAGTIAYALFGPSPHLSVGPQAGTAMMVAGVLTAAGIQAPAQRLEGAALLALIIGAVLGIAGAFRLGAIADFLSRPILVGYINGIALALVTSRVPSMLGIDSTQTGFIPRTLEIATNLIDVHWATLGLSALALVMLLVVRRVAPKLPDAVVVVGGGIVLSGVLDFEARGIRVLGQMKHDLPSLGLPTLALGSIQDLVPGALGIALLVFAGSALTSRTFADKNRYEFKANRELFGIAAANVAVSVVHGLPVAASDGRTAINHAAGARTQASGLIAALVVASVALLFAPMMAVLPKALLAAVVVASAISLFDVRGFVRICRVRPTEGLLALATFAGVLIFGILPGVLLAVALSIAGLVRRAAHPHAVVLGRIRGIPGYRDVRHQPGSETLPGLIIYRIDAPLIFANARFLREQVHELIDTAQVEVRMLVLDCGGMFDLDVTAAETLEELHRVLDERGITLALAEPHAPMRHVLLRSGLLESVGPKNIFRTVGEAIRAHVERARTDLGRNIDWQRVDDFTRPSGATRPA